MKTIKLFFFTIAIIFSFNGGIIAQTISAGPTIVSKNIIQEANCLLCGNYDLGCNIAVFSIEVEKYPIFKNDNSTIIGYKYKKIKYWKGCIIIDQGNRYVEKNKYMKLIDEWNEYK